MGTPHLRGSSQPMKEKKMWMNPGRVSPGRCTPHSTEASKEWTRSRSLPIVQLRIRSVQHACRSVLVNIFDLIRHVSICPVRRVDTSHENLKFDAFEIEESKGWTTWTQKVKVSNTKKKCIFINFDAYSGHIKYWYIIVYIISYSY